MKYLFAFILSTSILFTGIVGCSSPETNLTENNILATAGDDALPLTEFLYYFGGMKSQQDMFLQMFGFTQDQIVEYWADENEGVSQLDMTKQFALDHATDNATLYLLATEAGYTYDESVLEEIERDIDDFLIQLTTPETRGEDAFFNMFMITPQDYKDMQKVELTIQAYVESIFESISVSEEEILTYYEENRALVEDMLHFHAIVRHILISSTDDMEEEERAEATERANEILRRVEAGEDIGELAALYSEDGGSAQDNGEYDFHRGVMQPEFEDWAFSAQPGDIGMVQTVLGYHIMYSVDVDQIEDFMDELEDLVKNQMLMEIIRDLIDNSGIDWVIDQSVLDSVTVE